MERFQITVPASSANLGPGFDCLGLALNRYLRLHASLDLSPEAKKIKGPPAKHFSRHRNLALDAYWSYRALTAHPLPPVQMHIASDIPATRGMGSSAAFILAGLLLAFMADGRLKVYGQKPFFPAVTAQKSSQLRDLLEEVLAMATKLEGHPDNLAPALWGGLLASGFDGARIRHTALPLSEDLHFVVLVPDFRLQTSKARGVLPERVDRAQMSQNLTYLAFLLEGLRTGDSDLLAYGLKDRLHEPYRLPLIDQGETVRQAVRRAGAIGSTISGSGPCLLAYLPKELAVQDFLAELSLPSAWSALPVRVDHRGPSIRRLPSNHRSHHASEDQRRRKASSRSDPRKGRSGRTG